MIKLLKKNANVPYLDFSYFFNIIGMNYLRKNPGIFRMAYLNNTMSLIKN